MPVNLEDHTRIRLCTGSWNIWPWATHTKRLCTITKWDLPRNARLVQHFKSINVICHNKIETKKHYYLGRYKKSIWHSPIIFHDKNTQTKNRRELPQPNEGNLLKIYSSHHNFLIYERLGIFLLISGRRQGFPISSLLLKPVKKL